MTNDPSKQTEKTIAPANKNKADKTPRTDGRTDATDVGGRTDI